MTKIASRLAASNGKVSDSAVSRPSGPYLDLSVMKEVFWLTLRQQCRARRLIILSVLFALPTVIAILARYFDSKTNLPELEYGLIFNLIPHALVPLTALLYACGMIQDEIEEQTLTYLIIRPLPKWAIYVAKLAATVLVTAGLSALFTAAAFCAVHAGTPGFWDEVPLRMVETIGVLALTLVAYCAIFGFISLYVRRSLVVGIAYIVLLEGVLANIDFMARRLTVVYYFRVLVLRWVHIRWAAVSEGGVDEWSIDLSQAPSAATCIEVLIAVSLVTTILAALIFTNREFRLKTPEGS
jgi:ABC-2 type transport system permease protein